jgi:glycosyltransferase involved in cell wall biosynthesis
MTNRPRVSVLVTVYNREAFLAACLESILASTFDDFEIVIVDDGSEDFSVAIAEEFARRETRIRFVRNETNLGDYPNRMKAASLASGEYLKYVDSDDLIYPHTLAVMVEAMTTHRDADLGLSYSMPEAEHPYPWKLVPHDAWQREFLGPGCMSSGPTGAIIKRSAFFSLGGFRSWGVLSDTDMWYRMSAQAPIVLLPPGLVWWRRHPGQEFTVNGADLVYIERGFELTRETLKSNVSPLSPDETSRALARARQHHARRLISLGVRRGLPRTAFRLIRTSGLSMIDLARGLAPYA